MEEPEPSAEPKRKARKKGADVEESEPSAEPKRKAQKKQEKPEPSDKEGDKLRSRKCCAYQKALRLAKNNGASLEEAKAKAKEEPGLQ